MPSPDSSRPDQSDDCTRVATWLQEFVKQGPKAPLDMQAIGDHAAQCAHCYNRLSQFFKTVELPESRYLAETLDELAFSLYNLGRAIIRERPVDAKSESAVLRITDEGGGSAAENLESGVEMIDDAEDFAGSRFVGGVDLGELRALLESAESGRGLREDLALQVFACITEVDCRYVAKAWNWIGALRYQRQEFDVAEHAFQQALKLEDQEHETRAYAYCSLSYIHKQRGDLSAAIRSAERSSVFAEEDGRDPYFGRFAEFYFRLLRKDSGDLDRARELLAELTNSPDLAARFRGDLLATPNRPILSTLQNSPLGQSFAVDLAEDGPSGGANPTP